MIRRIAIALSVAFLLPALSRAADTYTPNYGLVLPALGSANWGVKVSSNFINIATNTAGVALSNTFLSSNTFNTDILAKSSVTASAFFGDGTNVGNVSPAGAAHGNLSGSYPNPIIGPNVILSSHVANGAITTTQISGSAGITGGQIAAGTVSGSNIAANTITNGNVASGNFGNITGVGTLTALTVNGLTEFISSATVHNGLYVRGPGMSGPNPVLLGGNRSIFSYGAVDIIDNDFADSYMLAVGSATTAIPYLFVSTSGALVVNATVTANGYWFPSGEGLLLGPNGFSGGIFSQGPTLIGTVLGVANSTNPIAGLVVVGDVTTSGVAANTGIVGASGISSDVAGFRGAMNIDGGNITSAEAMGRQATARASNAGSVNIAAGTSDGNGANVTINAGLAGGSRFFGGSANINSITGDNLGGESFGANVATATTAGTETISLTINGEARGPFTIGAHTNNGPAIAGDLQAQVRALTALDPANQYAYNGFFVNYITQGPNHFYDLIVPGDPINLTIGSVVVGAGTLPPLMKIGVSNGGQEFGTGNVGTYDWALGQGNTPDSTDGMKLDTAGLHLFTGSFSGDGSNLTGINVGPCAVGAGGGSVLCQSGNSNTATDFYTTVSGGSLNHATASSSVVPGGTGNTASGVNSFAAGDGATAGSLGSFVWSDSAFPSESDHGSNTFNVGSAGGVFFDKATVTIAYGIKASTAVIGGGSLASGDGLTVNGSSATVAGLFHIGWEHIINSCGAGVTTCTATCSAGKYASGGGCTSAAVLGVAVLLGDTGDNFSHTCTTVAATTLSADVYCSRVAP